MNMLPIQTSQLATAPDFHRGAIAAFIGADSLPISSIITPDHERMVRAYLTALTGGSHMIDDLSQEVFLRAIQRIHILTASDDPGRMLRGIARRVAHEHFRRCRRSRRYVEVTLDLLATEDECVATALQDREALEYLREAVDDLPIVSRRMLELRYHEGFTAVEIGEELGLQPGAVRITLLRIRERLRRRMDAALVGSALP
jgi:RNA polymerase sigma-70 factor (ECF subfamily)